MNQSKRILEGIGFSPLSLYQLDLIYHKTNQSWSDKEEQIIKKYYPRSTKEKLKLLLPNKNWHQMTTKACKLKIKRTDYIWNKKEIEILKKNYLVSNDEQIKNLLPLKILGSIKIKARKLNIKRRISWKKNEIKILRKNYQNKTLEQLAKLLLNRSIQTIKKRANMLGLKKEDKSWIKEQDKFLKTNYKKVSKEKLISTLNRTWCAIQDRTRFLKIKGRQQDNIWSKNENEIIKKYYSLIPNDNLKKLLLNRNWASIMTQACKLQCSKRKFWTKREDNIVKMYYNSKNELINRLQNRTWVSIKSRIKNLRKEGKIEKSKKYSNKKNRCVL